MIKTKESVMNINEKIENGYWNGKVYGSAGSYNIYVDNKNICISDDEAAELNRDSVSAQKEQLINDLNDKIDEYEKTTKSDNSGSMFNAFFGDEIDKTPDDIERDSCMAKRAREMKEKIEQFNGVKFSDSIDLGISNYILTGQKIRALECIL